MVKVKQIIFDDQNLILQTGDAGDCAANMGTYHVFLETLKRMKKTIDRVRFKHGFKEDFEKACALLEGLPIGSGLYRRYNNPKFWGSRTDTMSRDQIIPKLAAWALYGMKDKAWEYFKGHLKRGLLFTTNSTPNHTYPPGDPLATPPPPFEWTVWKRIRFYFGWRPKDKQGWKIKIYAKKMPDVTAFEFWALEIRALRWWLLWPVLVVLDAFTILGSLDKVYRYARTKKNADDRNHLNTMLAGLQIYWTPTMWIAALVYSRRPRAKHVVPLDGDYYYSRNGPQTALDYYYWQWNAPPFNELAEPIMEKYF